MSLGSFFEPLEGRRLLSGTVSLAQDGTLTVTGDNSGNTILVAEETTVIPFVGTVGTGAFDVTVDGQPLATGVVPTKILIDGGNAAGGDRLVFIGYTLGAQIQGGDGNDSILVEDLGFASSSA